MTGARWREIDLAKALWTIPADRIKGGKEHRVPLSGRAVAILKEMKVADCEPQRRRLWRGSGVPSAAC